MFKKIFNFICGFWFIAFCFVMIVLLEYEVVSPILGVSKGENIIIFVVFLCTECLSRKIDRKL